MRPSRTERQAWLNEFTKDLITQGFISGPPRDFERLTARDKRLVKAYVRTETAPYRDVSSDKLVWALIWGPPSDWTLDTDTGQRTPAPSDSKEETVFYVNNLLSVSIGDAAAAVRYLRQHTDGSSPEAMMRDLRKLLHKATVPLRIISNND
jgi:hypothetical protein